MEKSKQSAYAYEAQSVGAGSRRPKMAVPKPIRLMAAATMVLFLFLMVQIIRKPGDIKPPGSESKEEMDKWSRDPNLDGMTSACALPIGG